MKQFKFGNPPIYVNRIPIRKVQQGQNPAEKGAPVSKNQIQAKIGPAVRGNQAQIQLNQKSNNLIKSQKLSNPKFSPQQTILKQNLSTVNPSSVILSENKPQISKTPFENIRLNLGVVDPPAPPITSKIIKSNVSSKLVTKNGTKEPQGFKTKMQNNIDQEVKSQQIKNNKRSAQRAIQNKKSFNAVVEERPRRVTTQVNDALSSVNGRGGWRL